MLVTARLGAGANAHFYVAWMTASVLFMVSPAVASAFYAERSNATAAGRRPLPRAAAVVLAVIGAARAHPVLRRRSHPRPVQRRATRPAAAVLLQILVLAAIPDAITNLAVAHWRSLGQFRRCLRLNLLMAATCLALTWLWLPAMGIAAAGVAWLAGQSAGALVVAATAVHRRVTGTRAVPADVDRARRLDRARPPSPTATGPATWPARPTADKAAPRPAPCGRNRPRHRRAQGGIRPMRILHLANLYAPLIGGLERSVATSSEELVRRGHEVTVLTLATPAAPVRARRSRGVRVIRVRSVANALLPRINQDPRKPFHPTAADPLTTAAIRRALQAGPYDVVHSHDWLMYSYLPLRFGRYGRAAPAHRPRLRPGLRQEDVRARRPDLHRPAAGALRAAAPTGQYGRPKAAALTAGLRAHRHRGIDLLTAISSSVAPALRQRAAARRPAGPGRLQPGAGRARRAGPGHAPTGLAAGPAVPALRRRARPAQGRGRAVLRVPEAGGRMAGQRAGTAPGLHRHARGRTRRRCPTAW